MTTNIKLSMVGLAKFMQANVHDKIKILYNYKFSTREGKAMSYYYSPALRVIRKFIKEKKDLVWLDSMAFEIINTAYNNTRHKIKCLKNYEAIISYKKVYGKKDFILLDNIRIKLKMSNVNVSVFPELFVKESDENKVIKLDFCKDEPSEEKMKIISHLILNAIRKEEKDVDIENIIYADVNRYKTYSLAGSDNTIDSEINLACKEIENMWESLKKIEKN